MKLSWVCTTSAANGLLKCRHTLAHIHGQRAHTHARTHTHSLAHLHTHTHTDDEWKAHPWRIHYAQLSRVLSGCAARLVSADSLQLSLVAADGGRGPVASTQPGVGLLCERPAPPEGGRDGFFFFHVVCFFLFQPLCFDFVRSNIINKRKTMAEVQQALEVD